MKLLRILMLFGPVAGILVGCQCMPATEKLGNVVDAVNDHPIHLDGLYHAPLDLNRIGHPDWCESKFNQFWCRRGCCRSDRPIVMGAEHRIVGVGNENEWQEALPLSENPPPPPLPGSESY